MASQAVPAYDLEEDPVYSAEAIEKLLAHVEVPREQTGSIVEFASWQSSLIRNLRSREEEFQLKSVVPSKGSDEIVGWGDALLVSQVWHRNATKANINELHRCLQPGGKLGMIWSVEDYNAPESWEASTEWEQKLKAIMASLDVKGAFRKMQWKEIFESQLDSTPLQTLKDTFMHDLPTFSLPLGEESIKWTIWLSDEALWERMAKTEGIQAADATNQQRLKSQVSEILKSDTVERNEVGEVALHGVYHLVWTSRI